MPAARNPEKVGRTRISCENCRKRKRRCDGHQPSCRLCKINNLTCAYRPDPDPIHTAQLQLYVSNLERTMAQLRQASDAERNQILANIVLRGESMVAVAEDRERLDLDQVPRISKDGVNRASLHGPSSLYYLSSSAEVVSQDSDSRATLDFVPGIDNHLLQEYVDDLTPSAQIPQLSEDIWHYLLNIHMTWVQPLFGFVRSSAFFRDMQRPRTPHSTFSPFALYSLCAHASRHGDLALISDNLASGNPFLDQARLLVQREVSKGSSPSAISGLICLSAKEVAIGEVCRAWVYHMLEDLGIHLDGRLSQGMSPFSHDQLETRRRLFWTTYLWDKMISLYLGRTPKLMLGPHAPETVFDDDEEEGELWQPIGNRLDNFPQFQPTKSLARESFTFFCRLSIIINDILLADAERLGTALLQAAGTGLAAWRLTLPPELSMDESDRGHPTPPSHIINLNCLYHMVLILLDRRQYPGTARQSSLESALAITRLAQMSHTAYRDRQSVLSHCYCIYTAATVLMHRLRFGHGQMRSTELEETVDALTWCLHRLHETMATITAMKIPIAVLEEHLSALPSHIAAQLLQSNNATEEPPENLAPPDPSKSNSFGDQLNSMIRSTAPMSDSSAVAPVDIDLPSAGVVDFTTDFWSWLGGGELADFSKFDFTAS